MTPDEERQCAVHMLRKTAEWIEQGASVELAEVNAESIITGVSELNYLDQRPTGRITLTVIIQRPQQTTQGKES